jgi:hypothetical protein
MCACTNANANACMYFHLTRRKTKQPGCLHPLIHSVFWPEINFYTLQLHWSFCQCWRWPLHEAVSLIQIPLFLHISFTILPLTLPHPLIPFVSSSTVGSLPPWVPPSPPSTSVFNASLDLAPPVAIRALWTAPGSLGEMFQKPNLAPSSCEYYK